MGFFEKMAQFVINFISGTWGFMKSIAGTIVNSTFGWYTGKPISEDMAALLIYGGVGFMLVVYIFFRKSLTFK